MADRRAASEKPKGSGNPNRINRLLSEQARKNYSAQSNLIMLSNLGLNSEATAELRSETRSKGIRTHVVRTRLTLRAFREMGIQDAQKLFSGATVIVDADDPVAAAKMAVEFCKKFEKLVRIVGGLVEGKVLDAKAVQSLAKSKSKPELLAEIVTLAKSPGARVAGQLKGPGGKIAGALKAFIEKLEKASAAAPAPATATEPAAAAAAAPEAKPAAGGA